MESHDTIDVQGYGVRKVVSPKGFNTEHDRNSIIGKTSFTDNKPKMSFQDAENEKEK